MSKKSRTQVFRTGDKVIESGIYKVTHLEHRLPHEVTLLKDAEFPRCSKCKEAVTFSVIALAPRLDKIRERVTVYQLPELPVDSNAA
jgi:hypothetical protein